MRESKALCRRRCFKPQMSERILRGMECRLMTAGPERLSPLPYEEIAGCGGSTTVVSKALKDFTTDDQVDRPYRI